MSDKSVSAALRQLLQKGGDKLANRTLSRDDYVRASESLAKESRKSVGRGWGDQVKDGKKGMKK